MYTIFDIQHFSIHNGPGIRTTVFFKGCPLRCKWCHNPESIRPESQRVFRSERCIHCGTCLKVCPKLDNGALPLDERCGDCTLCIDACPTNALEIFGKHYTVTALMAELEKDASFYEQSGGGITLSGGEPLMLGSELIPLVKAIKDRGWHLTVDTCGLVPWETFETVLPYVDLYLYDFKHTDHLAHQVGTGVGVQLIIENYQKLSERGAAIWARLPMIPGYNTTPEHISKLAVLFHHHPPKQVHLLSYHEAAHRKYELLGLEIHKYKKDEDYKEQLKSSCKVFRNMGIEATIGG